MPGYSGTPLAKKLGIKAGFEVLLIDAPEGYLGLLEPVPENLHWVEQLSGSTDLIHLFCTERVTLEREVQRLRSEMRPDATIWVSWPKKVSKVETDIREDTVREVALLLGLVDVKVCAVDEVWSGLKLVVRKELR